MATDGSLSSQVEDWIVTAIRTIKISAVAVFESAEVAPWDGSDEEAVDYVNAHLSDGERDTIAEVRWSRDVAEDLEGGLVRRRSFYDVWVGIKNRRGGGAVRRGDGTKPGTGIIRDLLMAVLHNTRPDDGAGGLLSSEGWYIDLLSWDGTEIIYHTKGKAVMLVRLNAIEIQA